MGAMLDKKIKRFFAVSIVSVLIVCLVVFTWAILFMQKQTENSIEDISGIYMEEVSFQIQQKFSSITDLRLEQVNGIIKRTNPGHITYEELIEEIKFSTQVRDFTYMGLYSEDGEKERIVGDALQI